MGLSSSTLIVAEEATAGSRFDWHRNKGHANGAPRSTAHYAQDLSKMRM